MSDAPEEHETHSGLILDVVATALFGLFVVVVFLQYLGRLKGLPYWPLAAIPLVASLATLGWANLRVVRAERPGPLPPAGP